MAVALGSNVGAREAHLAFAVERLRHLLRDLRVSRFYQTEPVGVEPQAVFLNAAAVGTTPASPSDLLAALLAIERERGRERPYPGAPRTLDLDLVLHGDAIVRAEALEVPHPRFRDRAFVLQPLAEIAPGLRDPVTGLTVADLLRRLSPA